MKRLMPGLIGFLTAVVALPAAAAIYVINPDGTGSYATIQAAISDAAVVNGDIIELTNGTFTGDGNRDIDYVGKAITVRSQSGNPDSCIINCQGSAEAPHRGFFFQSGEGTGSVLEGVKIRRGYAEVGGGIYCLGSTPTITNCILLNNTAVGGAYPNGGGICGVSVLTRCVFINNTAGEYGGGAYFYSGCEYDSVSNCTFIGNLASSGGGIACWGFPNPKFVRCHFSGNAATVGGGASCHAEATTWFHECTFSGNEAGSGGGIYAGGALPWLTGCTLSHNTAVSGSGMHAIYGMGAVRTIIAFGMIGEAVYCEPYGSSYLSCCDVFGNQGGDYIGCIEGLNGVDGNISEDPLFCNPEDDDYTLRADSPCLPGNHPDGHDCDLIGAWPEGCPVMSVEEYTLPPGGSILASVTPNPFSLATHITYGISNQVGTAPVQLSLYDSTGRLVRALVDRAQPAGTFAATWDGRNQHGDEVAAGVYLCRLRLNGGMCTKRIVLIR